MDKQLIETGKIVGTHGVHGCLKVQAWADSPSVLTGIERVFVDGTAFKVASASVHKNYVLLCLEGVDSVEAAIGFKNKTVSACREDVKPEDGSYFIADLVGLTAIDAETGNTLGKITEVLTLPANNVYVVKREANLGEAASGETGDEILIPAVEEFIEETNLEKGFIKFRMIDGL